MEELKLYISYKKTERNLYDFGFGNDFLEMTLKKHRQQMQKQTNRTSSN